MKIAHIIGTFPPHIGGMGEVCFEEARALAERKHSVTVFALRYPGTSYHDEQFPFRVIRLRTALKTGDAGFVPQLFHKLRRFDIIHLHYPFYGGAEWVLFAKVFNHQKFVLTLHMEAQTEGFLKRTIQTVYDFLCAPFIIRAAEEIIAVDKHHVQNTKLYRYIKKRSWYELPHGVDMSLFKPEPVVLDDEVYRSCRDKKILLFVGNLLPLKRLDLLIKALYILHEGGNTDAVVWVVGGGYALARYQALLEQYPSIKDRVYFLGSCADKEKLVQYYNAAWGVVIPSRSESFSLVMNEARAVGIPVVVSRIPGLEERIKPGIDGFTFQSGDEADLACELKKLLNVSVEERERIGRAGRMCVQSFGWPHHIDALEKLYKSIVYKKRDGLI